MGLKIPLFFSLGFGRLFFRSVVVSEKACEQCFNTYRHRFPRPESSERKLSNNLTQAVTSNVNLWSANSLVFVLREIIWITGRGLHTRRALPLVTKYLGDLSVPRRTNDIMSGVSRRRLHHRLNGSRCSHRTSGRRRKLGIIFVFENIMQSARILSGFGRRCVVEKRPKAIKKISRVFCLGNERSQARFPRDLQTIREWPEICKCYLIYSLV